MNSIFVLIHSHISVLFYFYIFFNKFFFLLKTFDNFNEQKKYRLFMKKTVLKIIIETPFSKVSMLIKMKINRNIIFDLIGA